MNSNPVLGSKQPDCLAELSWTLDAQGRPCLAVHVLLWETVHLMAVSDVRGVRLELGFILVPSLLFCCFLDNLSAAEVEQNFKLNSVAF